MTSPDEVADIRYREVLQLEGVSLLNYRCPNTQVLFPAATSYPEFFNENLVSPYRIIK